MKLNEKQIVEPHCSYCDHFWSMPENAQMYCQKLRRRITARKKACKFFKPYMEDKGHDD